jgi:hypothetical protein
MDLNSFGEMTKEDSIVIWYGSVAQEAMREIVWE